MGIKDNKSPYGINGLRKNYNQTPKAQKLQPFSGQYTTANSSLSKPKDMIDEYQNMNINNIALRKPENYISMQLNPTVLHEQIGEGLVSQKSGKESLAKATNKELYDQKHILNPIDKDAPSIKAFS